MKQWRSQKFFLAGSTSVYKLNANQKHQTEPCLGRVHITINHAHPKAALSQVGEYNYVFRLQIQKRAPGYCTLGSCAAAPPPSIAGSPLARRPSPAAPARSTWPRGGWGLTRRLGRSAAGSGERLRPWRPGGGRRLPRVAAALCLDADWDRELAGWGWRLPIAWTVLSIGKSLVIEIGPNHRHLLLVDL